VVSSRASRFLLLVADIRNAFHAIRGAGTKSEMSILGSSGQFLALGFWGRPTSGEFSEQNGTEAVVKTKK
jgi:hypothetical protein